VALELVYWITLGLGLALLLLSLLLGDLFDFLSVDLPGGDFSAAPVFFAAVSAFGAGGLLGLEAFGLGTGGSVASGLGTGAVMGFLTALLFLALRRQESAEPFGLSQLIGLRGRCAVAIDSGGRGKVSVYHAGMTRSFPATSADAIAEGQEVVVTDVLGSVLTVSKNVIPKEE
jgi:membrane-bound ClpP family serine protease